MRRIALSGALIAAIGVSVAAAPGLEGMLGGFLAAILLAIAIVDAERYIIPNPLTAAALALALLRAALLGPDPGLPQMLWTLLRGVAAAIPLLGLMLAYRKWRGRDGLGLGDVKLVAVAGAWLGWVTLFAVIELAALAAIAAYVASGVLRNRPLKATALLPFGLFLAPAIWTGWLLDAWLD